MTLSLDLFTEQEVLLDRHALEEEAQRLRQATERSRALREDLVFPKPAPAPVVTPDDVADAFKKYIEACDEPSRGELPGHAKGADSFALGRLEDMNPHAFAFVAQARKHGSTDPSLTPISVSAAGRREFDVLELMRYANELLRGVRSIKPEMTPERWGEAIAKVREMGDKS